MFLYPLTDTGIMEIKWKEFVSVLQLFLWTVECNMPKHLPIGAVFDDPDSYAHTAFKYAISNHNFNQTESRIRISVQVKPVASTTDAYTFFTGVCSMMATGIFALVGQNSEQINTCAMSQSEYYSMPYISISPYRDSNQLVGEFLLRMRPSYTSGIVDLLDWLKWRRFFYLYNTDLALFRYESITTKLRRKGRTIYPEHARLEYLQNISMYQDLVRPYLDRWRVNVILDMQSIDETQEVLNKMAELRLRGPNFNIFITGLDAKYYDVADLTRYGTTVIGFNILDTARIEVREFYEKWSALSPDHWPGAGERSIRSEAAMAYDSVTVFTRAVDRILTTEPDAFRSNFRRGLLYNYAQRGMTCTIPGREWERGPMLAHAFRQVDFQGLTGRVAFHKNGLRKNYRLNLLYTNRDKEWRKFSHWTDTSGLTITDVTANLAEPQQNRKLPDLDKKMSDSADDDKMAHPSGRESDYDRLDSPKYGENPRIESNIKSTKLLDTLRAQCRNGVENWRTTSSLLTWLWAMVWLVRMNILQYRLYMRPFDMI